MSLEKINPETLEKVLQSRTHLVESYFFCPRQFFLNLFGVYNNQNKLLHMGRVLHQKRDNTKQEPVKVDFLDWNGGKLVEFKKREIRLSSEIQAYLYLKRLNSYGTKIDRAVVKSIEKRESKIIRFPDPRYEEYLRDMSLVVCSATKIPPKKEKRSLCRNCSLFEYCWVE